MIAPDWAVHLPPGLAAAEVDLHAGGSLPGAWIRGVARDPARVVLSTLDGLVVVGATSWPSASAARGRAVRRRWGWRRVPGCCCRVRRAWTSSSRTSARCGPG